jgi:hypothetical protein
VLVGGRYSYTALILSQLSPDTALEYWDYQARGTLRLSERDSIGFFAFGSYDYVGQRSEVDGEPQTLFGTQFHRLDLRYDHSLGPRGHLRTALTLASTVLGYKLRIVPCATRWPRPHPSSTTACHRPSPCAPAPTSGSTATTSYSERTTFRRRRRGLSRFLSPLASTTWCSARTSIP